MFAYNANHAQIFSWNQLILCNESKASRSKKQWEPLMGNKRTTDRIQVKLYPAPLRHPTSLEFKVENKEISSTHHGRPPKGVGGGISNDDTHN